MQTSTMTAAVPVLGAALAGVLTAPGLPPLLVTAVSDLAQLLAALAATLGCLAAARRADGPRGRAWTLVAAGAGAWAAGQAVWTAYEVGLGRSVPFPSLADVGFLAFPILCTAGLAVRLGADGHRLLARGRDLMDGTIIALSLTALSWTFVLAPLVAEGSEGPTASLVLSVAYPVGDVVLVTLVLLHLSRVGTAQRPTLVLLGLGLGIFAVADSTFVYLTTTGTYSSGDLVSALGWTVGLLLVATAGFGAPHGPAADVATVAGAGRGGPVGAEVASWAQMVLPYAPVLLAVTALAAQVLERAPAALADLSLAGALVVLLLVRQLLSMADNHRLLVALGHAHALLEHQAHHDTLTGLANRALFHQRLDAALRQQQDPFAVLFCDLDDFKRVNDELGHDAGDAVLRAVAGRLLACVRREDTVARLGGDEFALIIAGPEAHGAVAQRVVDAVAPSIAVRGHQVSITVSVGYLVKPVTQDAGASTEQGQRMADLVLQLADEAMYDAKALGRRVGKGQAVAAPTQEVGRGERVGLTGLEPVTSSLSGKRSNRLSYRPAADLGRRVVDQATEA